MRIKLICWGEGVMFLMCLICTYEKATYKVCFPYPDTVKLWALLVVFLVFGVVL